MIAGDPLGEEAITAIFSPEKRGYNPFGTRYVHNVILTKEVDWVSDHIDIQYQ